jgi:aspartyl-tRNA(Asn)/glutamyl-tRNA(Gln) amidotransferase subunit C
MAKQKISEADVRHVAHLSRLECTDEEARRFSQDLNAILEHMDKLAELDTDDVEPTSHALKMQNVFREDEVRPSLPTDEALANAPDREGPFFKVPQIIQEM